MGRNPSGAALVAWDRTTLDVGEARQGKLVGRVGEARLEARLALVQGQVILLQVLCLLLLEALVQVFLEVLVKVVVKVKAFVVQEVFLSSLSSTSFRRTRPAARVWVWILRVWVFSLRPLHPAGVVLDPFPETRPLP